MAKMGRPEVLALIPARGGSKGLPGKNIRPLGGKPLIKWSIEAAQTSRLVSQVVVSSDDPAILEVARAAGAETPFIRPQELAQDDTPSIDVVFHALDHLPMVEWLVLLQPTSPLRTAEDIDQAITRCLEAGAPACVSVTEPSALPWWMFTVNTSGRLAPFLEDGQRPQRRQEAPTLYALNGAIYLARVDWLRQTRSFLTEETVAHVMPAERSVDIDTALDFRMAECLLMIQRED
ncbi:MAG: acylneuraminate cytidylyltransferase family protein [Gammaproteobacteria bacterium]|nr:acylneuraminate cytidylyltransferase family protein [Gammaproteobacteria bacterium]